MYERREIIIYYYKNTKTIAIKQFLLKNTQIDIEELN